MVSLTNIIQVYLRGLDFRQADGKINQIYKHFWTTLEDFKNQQKNQIVFFKVIFLRNNNEQNISMQGVWKDT